MKIPGSTSSRSALWTTSCSIPEFAKSRKPVHVVLLNERRERVAADLHPVDEILSFPVISDRDGQVDIFGEPRLRPDRHGKAADNSPPGTDGV